MLIPFIFLKTNTTEVIKNLASDKDPLALSQKISTSDQQDYTHIIITHEGFLKDENGNRVDAIIVHAFNLSQKKGLQIAQKFNPKNTGEFKKIGSIETLGTPDLIFKLKNFFAKIDLKKEAHFKTEVKTDHEELEAIHTILTHDDPSIISEAITNFILEKLSNNENERYNGLFEINILKNESLKNIGLLRFLCSNAINEVIGSETSNIWMEKTKRKIHITCHYNNSLLHEARRSKNTPEKFQLDANNYADYNLKQLDKEFKSLLLEAEKNSNIKALMKLSTLNFEYNRRGVVQPKTMAKTHINTDNISLFRTLIIGSTVILFAFLAWLFLMKM
ncbi:MAG: hypothetical protein COB98_01020 [Flavobacteriaceae bacterium]|nr:MAG: hypothetical protein COB98_01020 [Flavobacteriaceae bacterium]